MKKKINMSAEIRNFLATNPTMKPKDAAEQISKQIGKKVSPTYVSNIKTLVNGKKTKEKPVVSATKAGGNLTSILKLQIKKTKKVLQFLEKTQHQVTKLLS